MSTKYFASAQSPNASFGWTLQQVLVLNFNARSSNGNEEYWSQDERDDMSIKYFAPSQAANASFGWTIQQLLLHKYTERRASCRNDEELSGYSTGLRVTDMSPSPLPSDSTKAIVMSQEIAECIKGPSPLRCTTKPLISAPNPGSTKCVSCSPASSVTKKLNISASIPGCTECIRCSQPSNDFTKDLLNSATNAGCTKCMICLSSSRDNTKPQSYAPRPYCTHCTSDNYLGNRSLDNKCSSLNLDEGTECDSLVSDEGYETVDKELDSGNFDTSLPVLCPRLMNLLGPISPDGRLYLEAMIESSTELPSARSGRRKRRKGRCDRLRYIHGIETDSPLQKELEEPRSVFFGTVNRLTLQLRNIANGAISMYTDLQQLKQDYQELDVGIGDVLEEAKHLKSELEALSYLDDLIWLLKGRLDLLSPRRWPFLIAQESFSSNLVI